MPRPITEAAGSALAEDFRGQLIDPDHDGYDDARRIWNGCIDRRPGLIARCTGTADVLAAVRVAAEYDLVLAVRGGGHSFPGFSVCDGGLVIDPIRRTAWAQGGATWGAFDRETHVHGLATPGGLISSTGVAGLTLGGGIGWLNRAFGLSCDNLLGAEVVTAAGEILHAGPDEHPDLFWGLRGGGGNFGVVAELEFALHPVRNVLGGVFCFRGDPEAVTAVVRGYASASVDEPAELTSLIEFAPLAAEDPIPQEFRNVPSISVYACHCDPSPAGRRALARFGEFAEPVFSMVEDAIAYADAVKWTRTTYDALAEHGRGTGYVNWQGDADPASVVTSYTAAALARLAEVKAVYDPVNLFRLNHNVVRT